MSELYNVGIYCRLSVDDANNTQRHNYIDGDESSSIENQRALLSKFTLLQGWIETKVYIDDGYSGGNFNRPGFNRMIEDARNGVINLILCKDLSRLGRDYIEVGRYTDILFPLMGLPFHCPAGRNRHCQGRQRHDALPLSDERLPSAGFKR